MSFILIDNIDKKILAIIQKNSGLPLSEISKRIGISSTPCWNRIKKMEEAVLFRLEQLSLIERQ